MSYLKVRTRKLIRETKERDRLAKRSRITRKELAEGYKRLRKEGKYFIYLARKNNRLEKLKELRKKRNKK